MFSLLLALQFLGSVVVCHHDNTTKVLPNRYINENSRSERTVYINGIAAEDVEMHTEKERSAVDNATVKRSTDIAQKPVQDNAVNDKVDVMSSLSATTIAANRWDITDILLNKYKIAPISQNSVPKREGNRWDITDILLNRAKYDSNSSTGDSGEVSRTAVYLMPGDWKKVSVSKSNTSSVPNEAVQPKTEDNKHGLRWFLEGSKNAGYMNLSSDDYKDFNVIEYLINDYLNKHPEAKSLHQKKQRRNRYLLQKDPPKDHILKGRNLISESLDVPMVYQGSTEDLSVQPQLFDFTPHADEEHQCTKATDGEFSEDHQSRKIKMYLENDQSTGMIHIDTRRVCQQPTGLTVKACDKIRPYVFLIPKNHVEFDVMVVRIQHKKSAQVTITVSCLQ